MTHNNKFLFKELKVIITSFCIKNEIERQGVKLGLSKNICSIVTFQKIWKKKNYSPPEVAPPATPKVAWNSLILLTRSLRTKAFRPSVHPSTFVHIFMFLTVRRLNPSMRWTACLRPPFMEACCWYMLFNSVQCRTWTSIHIFLSTFSLGMIFMLN